MRRIGFFLLFLSVTLAGCSSGPESDTTSGETATDRPNVVVLFTDDLGYGDIAPFGHPTIDTPHLSRMAEEGMKLTQF